MASAETIRKRQRDLEAFLAALDRLLAVMERHEGFLDVPSSWAPQPGREAEASRLRGEVDRLAGRAAYAFESAGSHVKWTARGAAQAQRVNPAVAWATILDPDPMFPVDAIVACANQALGILEMKAEAAEEEESREPPTPGREPRPAQAPLVTRRHFLLVGGWAAGVAGALLVAFLAFWLGWT